MPILYYLWLACPLLYFLIALWGYLERLGKSVRKHDPLNFLKQGLFILFSVGISILIDQYWLKTITDILPPIAPYLFYQIILLPLVFFLLSLAIGGTKPQAIKRKMPSSKNRG